MANLRPFIIAILFAVIAVVLVYMYIQKIEDEKNQDIVMMTVVRATLNIPKNTTVTEEMLEEIEMPEEMVTMDTVTELEEILGKVSVTNIFENQVLLNQMFEVSTELGDISRMLEPGTRAVTVGVTEVSGLGGNLKPGDKVDVLVTILSNEEVGVPSTFTVLRNVNVMAVGQDIGFEDESMEGAGVSKSVTLKVDTLQAERLALASEVGSLRLALRFPDDTFAPATGGTPLTDFVTYTPTREDLEDAAQRARDEQRESERMAHEQRLEEIRLWAEVGKEGDAMPDINNSGPIMPPTGPPPIYVEIILGGQSAFVELAPAEETSSK